MTKIRKIYKTETAHIVRNAVSERCKFNVHGHSYVWEVIIEGELNLINGMVLDFKELSPIKAFVDKFDHAMILWSGDEPVFKQFFYDHCRRVIEMKKNTTAENMARMLHKFTQTWLDTTFNSVAGYDRLVCTEAIVHETLSGIAIADDHDLSDIITYMHEDLA